MPFPDMIAVKSTTLEKAGYDADSRELYLQFVSGATYVYADVSPEAYQELLAADSLGRYFNRHIRPNYASRQVGPCRSGPPMAEDEGVRSQKW